MSDRVTETVVNFCHIQLSIIKERQHNLRKQLLDCKIQEEFILETIADIAKNKALDGDNGG